MEFPESLASQPDNLFPACKIPLPDPVPEKIFSLLDSESQNSCLALSRAWRGKFKDSFFPHKVTTSDNQQFPLSDRLWQAFKAKRVNFFKRCCLGNSKKMINQNQA